MEEDLTNGNPTATVDGNPITEPSSSHEGTVTPNGEARQSATAQDSFIPEGVDLNTLPPNVRAMVDKINRDMVRGFTEKTTKISETTKAEIAKATEAYRQKAESYDQIAQQESFVKQWNEYVQKANSDPAANGDPVEQLKTQLQEMNQKIQLSEMAQVTNAFADAVDEKGQKLHSDFDQLNSITIGKLGNGPESEDFSLLRACIELAPGSNPKEKLANGYKMSKEVYQGIFEAGKKAGMGRLQSKVQNSTFPPSNSAGELLSVTEKRPKTAREALDMAKKGQVVSRD